MTTLTAASTPKLTADEARSILRFAEDVHPSQAVPFLDALAAAEFRTHATALPVARRARIWVSARATFANPADHRATAFGVPVQWMLSRAVSGLPVEVRISFDTRGQHAEVGITIAAKQTVLSREVEPTKAHLLALLATHLPRALADGITLMREAVAAVANANAASVALHEAATRAVTAADARIDYEARLAALHAERAQAAEAAMAGEAFYDDGLDVAALITVEAREEALRRALAPRSGLLSTSRGAIVAPALPARFLAPTPVEVVADDEVGPGAADPTPAAAVQ